MLKAVNEQEDLEFAKKAAKKKAEDVANKLREWKLKIAAQCVSAGIYEAFTYYSFPSEHWVRIRTNNPMERFSERCDDGLEL